MLLHTVNKSPYKYASLHACLQFSQSGDAVVLLEDGVYGITHPDLQRLLDADVKVYAINADLLARGLRKHGSGQVETIDYEQFVALCAEFPRQKSW